LEHCGLDIFVEPNLIEVFINDGEYVISNVVYGLGNRITGYVEHVYTG
ncbi:MAG: glycoside hydrolase family 32 protein, partial [Ruminococcus sp.]|nr:glycoside hydrolase family 32 protein [Ruminococcus sp.]